MSRRRFIITCAGMSGSKWLAASLHRHPQIRCSHSAGLYTIYERNYTQSELAKILEKERAQFRGEITLDMILDSIDSEAPLCGNVHAFRLYRLKEALHKSDKIPIFTLANLIRHPFDVTLSRASMFYDMCSSDASVRKRLTGSIEEYRELFGDLMERYALDCSDYYTLCYLDAIRGLGRLAEEVGLNPDVHHIRIEDMRTPQNYIKLVDFLSGGAIATSHAQAEEIIQSPNINSHTKKEGLERSEKYAALQEWQKELLHAGLAHSSITPQYEKLGYCFDFLKGQA